MQCPAGRVFQYRVRSGQVLDKIPGSGSGSGRVGVSKSMIFNLYKHKTAYRLLDDIKTARNESFRRTFSRWHLDSAQRVPEPDPLPGISFDIRPDPIQF